MIRYSLVLILFSYLFVQSAHAQEHEPNISAVQQGNKTILLLSGNWTAHASRSELVLSTSEIIEKAAASKSWKLSDSKKNIISFTSSGTTDYSSIFILYSNSSEPKFQYRLTIDSLEYSGTINPITNSQASWFRNWTDTREGAISAFIPDGWKADLQIVRPYNSMTGLVFFARGEGNALAYVFYPFMPLHLLPEAQVCEELGTCDGIVSAGKVHETKFGNAPVAVAHIKSPAQYFESEVFPVLRSNLAEYTVQSASPLFALQYNSDNEATENFLEGLEVNYTFDAQGNKIVGKAALLISNHTQDKSGFWNGVVVGVESSQEHYENDFQNATVTLLTLRLNEKWVTTEQAVLDQSVTETNQPLRDVAGIIANMTLQEFDSTVSTLAHALVRSEDGARIGAYNNTATGEQIHLPEYESMQYWYLQDEELLGRKIGRNIMNSTVIEPLYR